MTHTDTQLKQALAIPLTNSTLVALVDEEHYLKVTERKWYLVRNRHVNYAATCMSNTSVYMHHFIFGEGMWDHKNHNGLDNTKDNVRPTNHSLNSANSRKRKGATSQYKGVCWDSRKGKWLAQICFKRKRKFIGHFSSEEEAAEAYNKYAILTFGDYAKLNVIALAKVKGVEIV